MNPPADRKKLVVYLVRHAQSPSNVSQKLDEKSSSISLTDFGREQINILGKHLSAVKITHAFSSDYDRAMETAKGILRHSKFSKAVSVETNALLRELDFGVYKNMGYCHVVKDFDAFHGPLVNWKCENGESFRQVGNRLLHFLENICDALIGKQSNNCTGNPAVLIVSHCMAIPALLYVLTENIRFLTKNWNVADDFKFPRNCSYTQMEITQYQDDDSLFEVRFIKKLFTGHLDAVYAASKDVSYGNMTKLLKTCHRGDELLNCCQQ